MKDRFRELELMNFCRRNHPETLGGGSVLPETVIGKLVSFGFGYICLNS